MLLWFPKEKALSDDLKVAFNSFLTKVEENWLQSPAKDPNTPLGSAHYTFWNKFNENAQYAVSSIACDAP